MIYGDTGQRAYLSSEWWTELRARYDSEPTVPHACAVCGTPRYQLHHRTYERCPGAERVSDLIALCPTHHQALHRGYQAHRRLYPETPLPAYTDQFIRLQRRRFTTAPLPTLPEPR